MTQARQLKPYDVEIAVAAGRDEIWDSVTQPAVLHQWFGWDYDGLAAEIKQIFLDEATLLAPERMGWADGSYLEVTGGDDTARVRVAREGNTPGGPEIYDAIEEGWRAFLIQLRFLVDRRPPGRRRTLYLTGETTGRQALTLAAGPWEHFGPRVAWTVTADDHLIVVASRIPLDEHAASHFEVTVSMFGADDASFETTRETWAKQWAPLAAGAEITAAGDPAPGS
ncbi:activator of HSP90 ATPase [Actinoplanes bogorensis]|uniref:Activator of HSP90 ATPase n=1 Tax=Paractinoplanes bogorensis TaxID=1610840 RepID=A0ABS5Z553_9ACTN|nr:activator of HSP90 ATPase [Actinoplanes bogorensis]MBU2670506.1 activator of HSP90 ATPase [Actinoplanes bogorensis]